MKLGGQIDVIEPDLSEETTSQVVYELRAYQDLVLKIWNKSTFFPANMYISRKRGDMIVEFPSFCSALIEAMDKTGYAEAPAVWAVEALTVDGKLCIGFWQKKYRDLYEKEVYPEGGKFPFADISHLQFSKPFFSSEGKSLFIDCDNFILAALETVDFDMTRLSELITEIEKWGSKMREEDRGDISDSNLASDSPGSLWQRIKVWLSTE